jgi:purine-binding chemotaxis protein CheW
VDYLSTNAGPNGSGADGHGGAGGGDLASLHCLICLVEGRACALPLEHVVEVMRPLPVQRVGGAPAFVLGLAVVRGQPLPVIDAALLLAGQVSSPTRFVSLRVGERRVVLAVTEVLGARRVQGQVLQDSPALVAGAPEVRRALGVLDGRLLEVLESARLIGAAELDVEALA